MRKSRTIETDIFGYPVREDSINSKKKGDANERLVSNWLESWTGVAFTRVPRSGGLRWKNTANVCGDVVCEDSDFNFPFTLETKHLKRITFTRHLRKNSSVYEVFRQCYSDCKRSGKRPLLMLRKDGMPKGEYVMYLSGDISLIPRDLGCEIISSGVEPDTNQYIVGYSSKDILNKVKFVELIKNS